MTKQPIDYSSTKYPEMVNDTIYDPILTYGRVKGYCPRQVIPYHVSYAQKCLKFKAFFRQSLFNSSSEYHRIRHVNIIYFLEDDTMCVIEPPVPNAGLVQGKLVNRARIPKSQDGMYYQWKDLNVGMDIGIYGIVYHTIDCDSFTNDFLRSQGIEVGDREELPSDPYIRERSAKENAIRTAVVTLKPLRSQYDTRRQFLEYAGMVLTFEAMWNNNFYHVIYFLTDDTMVVKEIPGRNSDRDFRHILLKRMRVPKDWTNMPITFPSVYLESTDAEIVEYYTSADFKIGQTIFIFGRQFLLCDCDSFTRNYYSKVLSIEQPNRILLADLDSPPQRRICKKENFIEQRKINHNVFKYPNKLRYLATMVAVHPEDEGREFAFEYNLNDGKLKINEIAKRNSGHRAGCFLSFTPVPKSGILNNDYNVDNETDENIENYSPEDFYIGAQINVFNRKFVIRDADLSVLQYMKANQNNFRPDFVENMLTHFNEKQIIKEREIDHNRESGKVRRGSSASIKVRSDPPLLFPNDVTSSIPSKSIDAKICVLNGEFEKKCCPGRRKITWADQCQIPCNL